MLRCTSAAAPKVEDGWRTTYALLVCCAGPPAAAFMADLHTTSLVINGACVLVLGAIVVVQQCFSMHDASNFYSMVVIVAPAAWHIYICVLMPRSELAALVERDIHTCVRPPMHSIRPCTTHTHACLLRCGVT